jgi:folate-dependent phosphoribosylglycinamide formyltransferase PurN
MVNKRIVIITGNETRHKYFVGKLANSLNLVSVFFERKANVHQKFDLTVDEKLIFDNHFLLREASEEKYFGIYSQPNCPVFEVKTGEINNEIILNKLKSLNIDFILLFGSSLIGEDILSAFPNKVINLHLGLSPYYRGSGTNFFPLVDNFPECVGATIHLAVKAIDAGGILKQIRPNAEINDTIHDLGNKTILKAIDQIPQILIEYNQKIRLPQHIQKKEGKLCLRKHLNASFINVMYENFENGMMLEYLNNKVERDAQFPIIS